MKKRTGSMDKIDTGRWLTTYSDLMNNLLVLFIALYAMSVVDMAKYQQFIDSFSENFGSKSSSSTVTHQTLATSESDFTDSPEETTSPAPEPTSSVGEDEFDALYEKINAILVERGYDDKVTVEKIDSYIYFRFTEGVFFYADQAILKENSYPVIATIGDILKESYDLIATIEISGHTAKTTSGPQSTTDFFSWQLSSDRALTVLKFLVQKCGLPQAKMSITGYSCNHPYVEGNSEEYWAQNRRVEIKISKASS